MAREPGADTLRSQATSARYAKAGLFEESSKRFDQLLDFKSRGAFAEGGRGRVGAPPEARRQLLRVTVSLLAAGWATKHVLQQILGLFASVFIFRREFFCVFHHMFKFLEDLKE